jgi:FAD:protein FMN transferase
MMTPTMPSGCAGLPGIGTTEMKTINRRRFLTISAAAAALAGRPAAAGPLHRWRGTALGASASITLAHSDAAAIIEAALAEITRLEAIFSLYRSASALSRLNAAGVLDAPPFELLECLGLSAAVHEATSGLFDPTIQPLWATYAEHHARGVAPDDQTLAAALARIGWAGVAFDARSVRLARPGMALTLNGVAQGLIADCVADLLRARGLTDVLVETGEYRALGGHPAGGGWPITLDVGGRLVPDVGMLRNAALASSAPLGTVFDAEGRVGHILHPVTGRPAPARWQLVSVTAPRAALADALSTAMCLMTRAAIERTLEAFPSARLLHLA